MKNVFLLIVIILSPGAGVAGSAYINVIPDLTQTDVTGSGHGNGQQYCAPVAVSNSIAWMSGNEARQPGIAMQLASPQYMNTSLRSGTGTTGVLKGVDRIARELFGGYRTLEYQGWRKHPSSYTTGVKVPDIDRLKSAISDKSAAWLNVGWYKYNNATNEYRRIGGHWVTLVGARGDQLIIHDPAPRAGKRFANEYVEYVRLQGGTLVGKKAGLPMPAKGYLSFGKGMHIKVGVDFAILDGVVYFEL